MSLFDMLRAESQAEEQEKEGLASAAAHLGLLTPGNDLAHGSGASSARPGSTLGLRAMMRSQGGGIVDSGRPETAASRLAQSLDDFSIRPGTSSSRGYGSVKWRMLQ